MSCKPTLYRYADGSMFLSRQTQTIARQTLAAALCLCQLGLGAALHRAAHGHDSEIAAHKAAESHAQPSLCDRSCTDPAHGSTPAHGREAACRICQSLGAPALTSLWASADPALPRGALADAETLACRWAAVAGRSARAPPLFG